jgi:superfamily II DNA/RNA helicase
MEKTLEVLKKIEFKICLIFYNDKNRGINLKDEVANTGFKSILIHGS